MKALLKILIGGLVVFQLGAIIQEWPLFASAWLGRAPERPTAGPLSPETRRDAEAALREFHAVSRHLYASGGDPRFAERLPAGPGVLAEVLDDIAYLQHRGLAQEATLMRLDVNEVRRLGEASVALDVREYWVFRRLRASDRRQLDEPRAQVLESTYVLRQNAGRWRVEAISPAPVELSASPGGGP